jgi:elongation factor 1-beta
MTQTFHIDNEAGVQEIDKFLANHSYLSGKTIPDQHDAKILAALKDAPDRQKHPNFFAWWWSLALFQEAARATWGTECAKKEEKKDKKKDDKEEKKDKTDKKEEKKEEKKEAKKEEDELDLFGDDNEEDKAALEAVKKQKEEDDKKKKAEKKTVIAKSTVVFDVKAYEETFDFVSLGKEIREKINPDGLVWQQNFKILPVAYQIKKLQCGMIIEDDKVSADDILEKIQELWPDDIQSCDIVEFNKV